MWQVREPLNLSHLGLSTPALSNVALSSFQLVTVLNLSHNKLTTLEGCGLGAMVSLLRLDLQSNLLEYVCCECCLCAALWCSWADQGKVVDAV
jgi:hypothetical protein